MSEWKRLERFEPGQLVLLTSGEYSNWGVSFVARVLVGFDPWEERRGWLEKLAQPEQAVEECPVDPVPVDPVGIDMGDGITLFLYKNAEPQLSRKAEPFNPYPFWADLEARGLIETVPHVEWHEDDAEARVYVVDES